MHWQQTRGETISDHEPFTVHFEGDRIVVIDRGHRQYLLTFRPYQRPPDPAVSTDYCPWVIDNDPDEGEILCGTELRATTGPRGTFEASVPLDTGSCGAAVRPATVPAGELRSLLARTCRGSFHDPEVLRSILPQDLGVMGVPVVRPLLCLQRTGSTGAAGGEHLRPSRAGSECPGQTAGVRDCPVEHAPGVPQMWIVEIAEPRPRPAACKGRPRQGVTCGAARRRSSRPFWSDRGCPVETLRCWCAWHGSGTARTSSAKT
jgi:hypothetical protein